METKRISRPVMVVLAVIAAAGAAAWIYQTMFGLGGLSLQIDQMIIFKKAKKNTKKIEHFELKKN